MSKERLNNFLFRTSTNIIFSPGKGTCWPLVLAARWRLRRTYESSSYSFRQKQKPFLTRLWNRNEKTKSSLFSSCFREFLHCLSHHWVQCREAEEHDCRRRPRITGIFQRTYSRQYILPFSLISMKEYVSIKNFELFLLIDSP